MADRIVRRVERAPAVVEYVMCVREYVRAGVNWRGSRPRAILPNATVAPPGGQTTTRYPGPRHTACDGCTMTTLPTAVHLSLTARVARLCCIKPYEHRFYYQISEWMARASVSNSWHTNVVCSALVWTAQTETRIYLL